MEDQNNRIFQTGSSSPPASPPSRAVTEAEEADSTQAESNAQPTLTATTVELSEAQKLAEATEGFWKLKLWARAVETIALSRERRPGISESLKKKLQLVVADMATSGVLSSFDGANFPEKKLFLTEEEMEMVKKWVAVEIKTMEGDFLEDYKEEFKGSKVPADVEFLRQLNESEKPVDLICERIQAQREEEHRLDAELEKWTKTREDNRAAYRNEVLKGQQELAVFQEHVAKEVELRRKKTSLLKHKDDMLTKKLELAEMQQTMDENPPELTEEMGKAYAGLLKAIESLETQIKDMDQLEAKYEAKGPEFKKLVAEWVSIEEDIETKEWVLEQLKGNKSGNMSLNDSLFSDSR